ncbi:hypothetical protein EDF56_111114 [Novosphingobium sp. PhB165]|uniref:DUF2274 domain-containing protein n=1 Tax=Novosphingobium sp. PhB165 TaxID=2485105 RepID=UPI0010526CA0|nr:DUF2274 domain-containing protein [Novosphingobium sp. PhB165]TCM15065.1 hypothetical protein EDF56_111114 [Novosphingobium sp. PhB165]
MTSVRLPKLPDRTPLKVAIHLMPDLSRRLEDYVAAYEATYGQKVTVAELIPAMLDGYINNDRAFARRKK